MTSISIDQNGCISCGMCSTLCPEVFVMDENGVAQVKVEYRGNNPSEGDPPADIGCVKDAVESCPVDVITAED